MTKNRFAALAFVFILSLCFADIAAAKSAPAKPKGAGEVEAEYVGLADLSAKFTQTTRLELVEKTVTKKGTFQFKKGGKWRIDYEGKDGKTYVSDGTTLWIYVPGDEASLQTFAVNDETVPKEALSFLSGFGKLGREFKVSESEAFPDPPAGTTGLNLIPLSGTKHYKSLDALFGPDRLLMKLIVHNTSGNVSTYVFSDVKTNSGLADKIFTLSTGKATPATLPE